MSKWEQTFVYTLAVMIVAFGGSIFYTIATYEPPVYESKPWEPPAIPKCDKELWDRIREGCK